MSTGRTDEFRKEAVRIALTSGLSRRQVADDLGVGFSTLNKWMSAHRGTGVVSAEGHKLARENGRLCRVMNVSPRGLRAFRKRPASPRQRIDMVVLERFPSRQVIPLGLKTLWPTSRSNRA
jgi:transposase